MLRQNVTKYQRYNLIIQIHQFTIKIDKINTNLLFECVKIVEFNFNSHLFHVMYQETRFLNQDACFLNQEGRRQFLISLFPRGTETEKSAMLHGMLHEEPRPFLPIPALPR